MPTTRSRNGIRRRRALRAPARSAAGDAGRAWCWAGRDVGRGSDLGRAGATGRGGVTAWAGPAGAAVWVAARGLPARGAVGRRRWAGTGYRDRPRLADTLVCRSPG